MAHTWIIVNDQVQKERIEPTLTDILKYELKRAGYEVYNHYDENGKVPTTFKIGWENKFLWILPILSHVSQTHIAEIKFDEAKRCLALEVYGRKYIGKLKDKLEKIAQRLGIEEVLLNLVNENPIEYNYGWSP